MLFIYKYIMELSKSKNEKESSRVTSESKLRKAMMHKCRKSRESKQSWVHTHLKMSQIPTILIGCIISPSLQHTWITFSYLVHTILTLKVIIVIC